MRRWLAVVAGVVHARAAIGSCARGASDAVCPQLAVETRAFDPATSVAECMAELEPVLFSQPAAVQAWRALKRWTPDYFSTGELGSTPLQAYVKSGPTLAPGGAGGTTFFSTYADFPLPAENDASIVDTTARAFWQLAGHGAPGAAAFGGAPSADTAQSERAKTRTRNNRTPNSGAPNRTFAFAKAVLANFPAAARLAGDVEPNPFHLQPASPGDSGGGGGGGGSGGGGGGAGGVSQETHEIHAQDHDLWLSGAGVRSHSHFDYQHNFYTQVTALSTALPTQLLHAGPVTTRTLSPSPSPSPSPPA